MGSKPTPGTILFAGSDPSRHAPCTRSQRVWPPQGQAKSGHAQGPRISLARRLSSVRVRGAPPNSSPIIQLVGAPVVTREIQVRLLVGEPMRRARLVARTCRFSAGRPEFESPSRHQSRTRSSTGQSAWLRTREVQVRVLPCAPCSSRAGSRFRWLAPLGASWPVRSDPARISV